MATETSRLHPQHLVDRLWYRLRYDHKFIYIESILSFIVLWAFVANVFEMQHLISSPTLVGTALYELLLSDELWIHLPATMYHLVVGFVLAMIFGTVFGILMSLSDHMDAFFRNWMFIGLALPGLFVVVFGAMWFGLGPEVPILVVAVTVTPYVAITLSSTVDDIDAGLFDMADAFGVSRKRVIRHSILPAVVGEFFGIARFGISVGWKEVMLAEFVAAQNARGVGAQIAVHLGSFNLPGILKWGLVMTLIVAFIQFFIFKNLEEWMLDWREDVSVF